MIDRSRRLPDLVAVLGLTAVGFIAASLAPRVAAATGPTTAAAAPEASERLARLVRLWGTVRFQHPYLAYREIDWDEALAKAVPRVRLATSRAEYAAAVRVMLDTLGDPATHLVEPAKDSDDPGASAGATATPHAAQAVAAPRPPLLRRVREGLIVFDLRPCSGNAGYMEMSLAARKLGVEVAKAKGVVFDLRQGGSEEIIADALLEPLAGFLTSHPTHAPAQRILRHAGYHSQDGEESGGYRSFFETELAESLSPVSGSSPKRVVFVVNRRSSVPTLALALQRSGDGFIVLEGGQGGIADESVVAGMKVDLGEGLSASVRLSELVPEPGWPGLHADVEVPAPASGPASASTPALPSGGAVSAPAGLSAGVTSAGAPADPALAAAIELAGEPAPPGAAAGAAARAGAASVERLPEGVWRRDNAYESMTAPDLGHRVLAVARYWNVIHFFYAYRELIGDWDACLPQFLRAMEKAEDAQAYALAVAQMATHVPDGHSGVYGAEIDRYFGEAGLPVALRWLERRSYVVTGISDEPAVKASGLAIGDVLEAVDGEPVAGRVERYRRYLTASTPAALALVIGRELLRGREGSLAELTVRASGGVRHVKLQRHKATFALASRQRVNAPFWATRGDTVRLLPGNLGYVDLTRLTVAEVSGMFERLAGTRGIVFDLRGYPKGTAWSIAPRLNVRGAKVGAQFREPDGGEMGSGRFFAQPLPEASGAKYTAPTVMLIDERTISQAEHTGLFFEAANGTRFIGTPSAGANGDVTVLTVPGGLTISFTGHDVRHADGRQLQRVGLVPDVEVAPTIQGVRDGRDEVLERAIRDLEGRGERPAGR
jgi:C-terminal processing protease CtpA/Prc